MRKKLGRESKQISLTLEFCNDSLSDSKQSINTVTEEQSSGILIHFKKKQSVSISFRDRVVQELKNSRIMIAD